MSTNSQNEVPYLRLSTSLEIFNCDEHFMNIWNKLRCFYEEKKFFDVHLKVGAENVIVPAHRIILSASSTLFNVKNPDDIELKQFDVVIVKQILNFMYTAKIEISNDTIDALRDAAEFFNMETIKAASTSTSIKEELDKSPTGKVVFKCDDHFMNISIKLQEYYQENKFFDIHLRIDTEKFNAHKIILAASSDYFGAMFRNSLDEIRSSEVQIKDVNGATMRLILDFIYNASIELCSETIEDLLRGADFFQINALTAACCNFVEKQLDASNCLGIFTFAEQYNYSKLAKKSSECARFLFAKLYKEEEFLQLSEQQFVKLISSNELYAHLEEDLFLGLAAWVNYYRPDREKCIPKLLSFVCFKLLKPEFIKEKKHLLSPDNECEEIIDSWLQWHLSHELSPIENSLPRKIFKKIIMVGIGIGVLNWFKVLSYDPELEELSSEDWPAPTTKRSDYATIVIGNSLIIAGGRIDYLETNTIECLDLKTLEWTSLPSMKHARYYCGIVELNGEIYVVGGEKDSTSLCCVEKYSFSKRKWIDVAPMLSPCAEIQVVVLNDQLYVVDEEWSSFQCYDPIQNKWSQKAVKNKKTSLATIVSLNGYLYAIGGYFFQDSCATVERYDPETNVWTIVAPAAATRGSVQCVVWNGKILAFLGFIDGVEVVSEIEEYTTESNTWKTLPYSMESVEAYALKALVVHLK